MTLLSGIVTSLALVALALPTIRGKSTDLTPDNFKSSVSNGFWFVEHFSPYCSHCIAFAPTWDKLVKEAETELPNVSLGQVNCVVHGGMLSLLQCGIV
jgi:thioredoxin domain-containing protein 5